MNNESLSENLSLVQETIVDEIPEAVRDPQNEEVISTPPENKKWIWSWVGIIALIAAVTLGLQLQSNLNQVNASSGERETETETDTSEMLDSTTEMATTEVQKNLLSEMPYSEATEVELAYISTDSDIKLKITAAKRFQSMLDAAKVDGINLVPLRGFKSKSDLENLVNDADSISTSSTDKLSALSYGEYMTGYAVDIGDGNAPVTHQTVEFENTAAFRWLQNYAAYYSFEMIPSDAEKGIGYEPWHWRYVGDRSSLETFYKNQSLPVPEASQLVP
ncbi:MAG: D-alanyl-D-alanine carboxypeptidase family protein [Microcoleaceae cyanobacterium MO_207.B10]|nr:D-alanyl-D-alanine carboxypeptidase family protein [Microcoleaceae cyanobacterium MO_207.B10]